MSLLHSSTGLVEWLLEVYLPGRKVDRSRSGGRANASSVKAASITGADGVVNGSSVISHTVSNCAIVLDVSEDLVGGWIEIKRGNALVSNVLHPVGHGHLDKAGHDP